MNQPCNGRSSTESSSVPECTPSLGDSCAMQEDRTPESPGSRYSSMVPPVMEHNRTLGHGTLVMERPLQNRIRPTLTQTLEPTRSPWKSLMQPRTQQQIQQLLQS